MTVKPGYKQTEIGIVPEDWDVEQLSDLTRMIGDGIHATPEYVASSEYFFINGNNLLDGSIHFTENTKCVDEVEYKKYRKQLDGNTLLMSINGTIGNLAFFKQEKIVLGKSAAYINVSQNISKEYIFYTLQSYATNEFYENELTGTTIRNLSLSSIRNTPIPIPNNENEQRLIAAALSDMDALLAALDALIAKKRLIKQGAMQELLTPPSAAGQAGQCRLPGFSGEWKTKTLEETVDCLDNLRVPLNETQREKMRGNIPYCGANGVLDYVNDYVIDDNIILIAEDGGYFDEYATRPIAYQMSGKCWVNNHAHILKAKDGINQDFVFFSLVHKNILPYLSGGTRAKLNKFEMYKIEIVLPKEENEQTAIAEVLSDMDAEIRALEQRRAKTRLLKQGMMQELLTGRVRLV